MVLFSVQSDALLDVLTPDVLPDGKLYYNIAERTVRPTIEQSHELFSEAAAQIQKQLNENAGIGLRAVTPKLDEDRVRGIIDKISDAPLFEDVRWVLGEPIRTLTQSFADDFVQGNAEFQSDAGLSPTITRTVVGGCCQWCRALAGKYTYPREVPKDVYRRHAYCRCLVTYDPADGSKRRQDVHSKKWRDGTGQENEVLRETKIERTARNSSYQNIGLDNDRYNIAQSKISEFLLKPGAKHASDFFGVGYSTKDGALLNADIYRQFDEEKKVDVRLSDSGEERFSIFMNLGTMQTKRFRTVWIREADAEKPRFITAYREDER